MNGNRRRYWMAGTVLAAVAAATATIGCNRSERAGDATMSAFAEPDARVGAVAKQRPADGMGPGRAGDRFDKIDENRFLLAAATPLSTFSIDVDTASYSKVRQFLLDAGRLPPEDAVRIEEMINYFSYAYAEPSDGRPFTVHVEVSQAPWRPAHELVRIGLKGKSIPRASRPPINLVFLVDVSGSMQAWNKLPLLKRTLRLLVGQLDERDSVAMVVYAGAAGVVLPPTHGDDHAAILEALNRLRAGGSTNGGEGIELAYRLAAERAEEGGVNRVILCTDGDFNVGTTSTGALVRLVEQRAEAGIGLTVLGFGMGNLNDGLLEQISNKGDGNYAFIDSAEEARKVLVDQMLGTLVTIAKDVKIQVEFNPSIVKAYRLIGYENRLLATEDFNDDTKDAGEIGAGHTVTALYEVVRVGADTDVKLPSVDPLKYGNGTPATGEDQADSSGASDLPEESQEWFTVKIRYKRPGESNSERMEVAWTGPPDAWEEASIDQRFAASVAAFGMLLRRSDYAGGATFDMVRKAAGGALGRDAKGHRREFVSLVEQAKVLAGAITVEPGE